MFDLSKVTKLVHFEICIICSSRNLQCDLHVDDRSQVIVVRTAFAPFLYSETRAMNRIANALRDLYIKGFTKWKE